MKAETAINENCSEHHAVALFVDAPPKGTKAAPSQRFFYNLEAMRGLCALLVALFHAGWASHLNGLPIVRNGWLFVDFFFILSGFVMAHTYWDRLDERHKIATFLVRRLFRLYPMHVLAYAASFLVVLVGEQMRHVEPVALRVMMTADSLKTVLLIQTILPSLPTFNTPSWSISAEFWTYLVFAGVAMFARNPRVRLVAMSAVGLAGLAVIMIGNAPLGLFTALEFGFPRCLVGFALGVIVFETYRALAPRPGVGLTSALLAVAFISVWWLLAAVDDASPGNAWALPLFAAIILLSALDPGSPFKRVLESAPARLLGAISYSIYMLHVAVGSVVAFLVTKFAPHLKASQSALETSSLLVGDLFCFVYALLVVALAYVGFHLVEKPGRDIGVRISRRGAATA